MSSNIASHHPAAQPPSSGTVFRVNLDKHTLLFIALFVLATALRLFMLSDKAMHHDESLYGKYSWNLFRGEGYTFDPMQHGPFLFHQTALYFFLFGDTEWTARFIPVSASLLVLFLIWTLRHQKEYGRERALIAGTLFAISPITLYFSRTFIHDLTFLMHSMAIPAFLLLYERYQRQIYRLLSITFFAFMFATKANAFVTTLVLLTYVVLYAAAEVWRANQRRFSVGGALSTIRDLAVRHSFIAKWWGFVVLWGVIFTGGFALPHIKKLNWFSTHQPGGMVTESGKVFFMLMFLFFIVLTALVVFGRYLYDNGSLDENDNFLGMPKKFYDDGYTFGFSFFLFGAINVLLHTSFFRALDGPLQGIWNGSGYWFIYWYHQHNIARIKGPFFYYIPHFILYDPLTFLAVVTALIVSMIRLIWPAIIGVGWMIIATILNATYNSSTSFKTAVDGTGILKLEESLFVFSDLMWFIGLSLVGIVTIWMHLREEKPFRAFVLTWAGLAFLIYSYLQEKVPWLGVHVIFPMQLYAAFALYESFKAQIPRIAKYAIAIPVTILALFTFHTAVDLCYLNADNGVEQMVYVHTTRDVLLAVEDVHRMAQISGLGYNMPIASGGNATWPLSWYLRYYKKVWWSTPPNDKYPVFFTDWEQKDKFEKEFPDFVGRRIQLRAWWIPSMEDWFKAMRPGGKDWKKFWRYLIYRERFSPERWGTTDIYGSSDVIMWVNPAFFDTNTWEMVSDKNRPNWWTDQQFVKPKRARAAAAAADAPAGAAAQPGPEVKDLQPAPSKTFGARGAAVGQFDEPKGLAVSADGFLYVADAANHRVQKLTLEGKPVWSVGTEGDGEGQFKFPTDVALDEKGNLYVADAWNHRVQVLSTEDGKFRRVIGSAEVFFAPKGLQFDKQTGHLFVVATGHHTVRMFTAEGSLLNSFGEKSDDGAKGKFFEPVGIAQDAQGNLYVGDTANKRIQKFNRNGIYQMEIPVTGLKDFYSEPMVDVDAKGNIYMTDSSESRVYVYNSQGQQVARLGSNGPDFGEFSGPRGIAVAADGTLYVADTGNHRIQVFPPVPGL